MTAITEAAREVVAAFLAYDRALQRYGTLGQRSLRSAELDSLYTRLYDAIGALRALLDESKPA